MSKELQEVVTLWKRYTEETQESRRLPNAQVTDDMREKGLLYFRTDFNGFMNWLAKQDQ